MFTCCHPALDLDAQVSLTLRTLAGLTTAEIARAFLVSEQAMSKRLVRAKAKIRQAAIPYRVPPAHLLPERRPAVLAVLYLLFNEGYTASAGADVLRQNLTAEAIRLARVLVLLMPGEPEAAGLLALMLLHDARRATRLDPAGDLVTLEDQDRSRWDAGEIAEGTALLDAALPLRRPGPYQVQAAGWVRLPPARELRRALRCAFPCTLTSNYHTRRETYHMNSKVSEGPGAARSGDADAARSEDSDAARSEDSDAARSGDSDAARRRRREITAVKDSLRELSGQLSVLNHHVSSQLDLKDTDLECLDLIARHGPLSPSVLARRAGLHPATMTGILDRLERGGWISRERDPDAADRRAVAVRARRDRNPEVFRLYAGMNTLMDQICDGYTEAELRLLNDFLRRVTSAGQDAAEELGD